MLNNAPLLTSEKIFSACANRIRSLSSFISTNDLLCAAKLICEARMCHIIGAGNTIPIASDLRFRLQRNGQSCMYSSLPEQYFNNIALGDSSGQVFGGHIVKGYTPTLTTVDLLIFEIKNIEMLRVYDEETDLTQFLPK